MVNGHNYNQHVSGHIKLTKDKICVSLAHHVAIASFIHS